jgi:hypothetical protein
MQKATKQNSTTTLTAIIIWRNNIGKTSTGAEGPTTIYGDPPLHTWKRLPKDHSTTPEVNLCKGKAVKTTFNKSLKLEFPNLTDFSPH